MVEYEDKIKYMELVNKTKDSIELTFGKINANIKVCDLIGMTRSMVRITDNARALKEQNGITSN